MRLLRSVRSRLLLGSVLWTIGLLPLAHVISIALLVRFPSTGLPRVIRVHPASHDVIVAAMAHYGGALALAVIFMVAGFVLVRSAIAPMQRLRDRLAAVHDGRERRIEGVYPSEIQPLVDDLNALLANRDQRIAEAHAKAGDLAHGLKTPLAVLAHDAERARAAGHLELAEAIEQQVERMRRQVDYHLAQARAAASGATPGAHCQVAVSAEALARTLRRLHAARGLTIDVQVPADHAVRGQREDLDEMLGNLLDNACKWAAARVQVSSINGEGGVNILVDDDGPGLAPALRDKVLQRGVRADEAAPGSGLGLAIVRELAGVYGGSVALDASPLGGLRARLQLPAAPAGHSS